MATANWQSDQPTNLNYLSPVNFDLLINKLPKTRYFCVGATLPGITFGEALHDTTLAIRSYLPGDRISFEPLTVRFAVDEDMKNYQEIFNWIMQLGPGVDSHDFASLIGSTGRDWGNRSGDFKEMYSDATLMVNTSSNNANLEVQFIDCFPTSLGSVEFKTDATEVEYAVADLTMRYTYFKIKPST